LFEPLIKNLVRKLDIAAEAYLERQQLINLLAVPGTLMFLLLFWAFSGAGGFVLVLGLFVVAIEVGIAVGLFLLKDKYGDQVLEWSRAADAIEGRLTDDDLFGEWTEFLQNPADDQELEQIRALCQALPDRYPTTEDGAYCGPDGIALMQECVDRLRVGIVARGYEDFTVWWAARQEARHGPDGPVGRTKKKRKKKIRGTPKLGRATPEDADAVLRMASLSGAILDQADQERVDREADTEIVQAGKEERREAKRAARTARKATRRAVKQEKKLRHRAAATDAVDDEMLLYEDEDQEESVPQQPAAPTQTPRPPQVEQYEEEEEPEDEQEAYHSQIPHHPPPPPPASKRRRQRGLTEAAAIQEVMLSGLTAHHYDDAQVRLTEQLGRYPKPREVVKALKSQFSKKGHKRAKNKKVNAGGSKRPQRPMGAFRIDSGSDMQKHRQRRPAGTARTMARMVFAVGLIVATPFALWRIPRPETKPITIEGEVAHRILDHAPDMQHQLRTPFEELFGYKAVNLVAGERIYVNADDYRLCWPESWDAIYEGRYKVNVTAEVTQLLFGGYSVARITSSERVDLPVATGNEYTLEAPDAPAQWQPTRRYHRRRFGP